MEDFYRTSIPDEDAPAKPKTQDPLPEESALQQLPSVSAAKPKKGIVVLLISLVISLGAAILYLG